MLYSLASGMSLVNTADIAVTGEISIYNMQRRRLRIRIRTAMPHIAVQNHQGCIVRATFRGSGVVEYAESMSSRLVRCHTAGDDLRGKVASAVARQALNSSV